MGRDDSWPGTALGVVRSYSHANTNLIGPAQLGFPMSWFLPTARMIRAPVNSTRPQNLPFSVSTAQNGETVLPIANLMADPE